MVPTSNHRRCNRHSTHGRRIAGSVAIAVAALLLPTGEVRAQASALSVEVEPGSDVSRTGGPIALSLRFDWRSSGIFDGQLLIELRDSEGLQVGSFLLDDLYLSEGTTRQQIMLPGTNVHSMNNELLLHMWLLDRNGRELERLSPARVRVAGQGRRALVIAVCRPEFAAGGRTEYELTDALRLEGLFPDYQTNRPSKTIVTRTVDLVAEDAPSDPLRLCAYDLVLLPDTGLAALGEPQLDALLAWIRAGGAACVVIDRTPLDQPHIDFLNELIGGSDDDPLFLADRSGNPVYGAAENVNGPLKQRCGLGRAVIVGLDERSADAETAHWPLTAAFLWRLRSVHLDDVASRGLWDLDYTLEIARTQYQRQQTYSGGYVYEQPAGEDTTMQHMQATDMDPIPVSGGTGLLTRLMPSGIQVVPLWLIALILIGYVGVIGPLDYLVLGRLGLRKFTWVSFPVLTLVFTLFSVLLSNSYLSVADHRNALLIRDLAEDGTLVRENRLELLFPSTSREIPTELGRGLFCPLRHQDFSQQGYWYGPYGYQMWEQGRAEPAHYIGRMPIRATVVQRIGQWTPQLNRSLTIPLPGGEETTTPLADPELEALIRHRDHGSLLARLREQFPGLEAVYLFHGADQTRLEGPESLFASEYEHWHQVYVNGEWISRRIDFLEQISVRNQAGFFAVVSGIAPTGGHRLEDLAVLDATNDREWLLVAAARENDTFVIYRKLYVLDD